MRSCHSGQQIPCFDSCELTIIWMSIIKLNTGYRLPCDISHWFPCGAAKWRGGQTYSAVTLLPRFLGCIHVDKQIFLTHGALLHAVKLCCNYYKDVLNSLANLTDV